MRTILPFLALTTVACIVEVEDERPTQRPDISQPAPVTPDAPSPPTSGRPDTTPPPAPVTPPPPPSPATPAPPPSTGTCEADRFEPTASGVSASSPVFDLTLEIDDVDRFAVTLGAEEELFVDALFANADGNLDLYLTDVDGELLSWSTTDDDDEALSWYNDTGDALVVLIETNLYMATIDTCVPYDLHYDIVATECPDDGLSPNQTYDTAFELVPDANAELTIDGIADDEDWFYLSVFPEEELEIIIRHDVPGADLDLTVWDEIGEVADVETVPGVPSSVHVHGGSAGQMVDLLVAPTGPATCAPYTLEILPVLGLCFEDDLEPNDQIPSAVLPPLYDLSLFAGDIDTFDIEVFPGEELQVDAFFSRFDGNLDLALYGSDGVLLASSASNNDDEFLVYTHDLAFAEHLTLEVDLFAADGATCLVYDLDWAILPPLCFDDGFEQDDAPAFATELIPEYATSLTWDLVADDEDWFYISALPGEELDLTLSQFTFGADLELVVYDEFGEVAYDWTDSIGQDAGFTLAAGPNAVLYDIVVRPAAGSTTCVDYSLTVTSW